MGRDDPLFVVIWGGDPPERTRVTGILKEAFPEARPGTESEFPNPRTLHVAFDDAAEVRAAVPNGTVVAIAEGEVAGADRHVPLSRLTELGSIALDALELGAERHRYQHLFEGIPVALWEVDLREAWDSLVASDEQGEDLESALERAAEQVEIHQANDEARSLAKSAEVKLLWPPLLRAYLTGSRGINAEHSIGDHQLILSARWPGSTAGLAQVVVAALDVSPQRRLQKAFMAAQRMEAVGQLAAGIAHDFNNILMVVGTYAEFLRETVGTNPNGQEDLDVIVDGVQRATGLVSQLLAFTRRQAQSLQSIDLVAMVTRTQRMLERVLGEDIEMRTVLHDSTEAVMADPTQLDQVLMNLVVNARDAMPKGGVLTLATRTEQRHRAEAMPPGFSIDPGRYTILRVEDSGVGMSPEIRDRIFEPFYTTKADRGSGLGLSTVYGIVKQSGGYIVVESEIGKGTAFEVFLPAAAPAPREDLIPARPSLPPENATVLLVEDNHLVRKAAHRVLEGRGYRVLDAADPEAALAIAATETIDVLVTDVVMPGMNGVELHERLLEIVPDLAVVFTSGYNDHGALREAVERRDAVFVQKPMTGDELEHAVSDVRRRLR